MFDDKFLTAATLEREQVPPPFGMHFVSKVANVYIPVESTKGDRNLQLIDDWLTPEEQVIKQREIVRLEEIRNRINTTLPRNTDKSTLQAEITTARSDHKSEDILSPTPDMPTIMDDPVTIPVTSNAPHSLVTSSSNIGPHPIPMARQSERSTKGQYSSTRYFDKAFLTHCQNKCM